MRLRISILVGLGVILSSSVVHAGSIGTGFTDGFCNQPVGQHIPLVPSSCSHVEAATDDGSVSASVSLSGGDDGNLPDILSGASDAGISQDPQFTQPAKSVTVTATINITQADISILRRLGNGFAGATGSLDFLVGAAGYNCECLSGQDEVLLSDSQGPNAQSPLGLHTVTVTVNSSDGNGSPMSAVHIESWVQASASLDPPQIGKINASLQGIIQSIQVTSVPA